MADISIEWKRLAARWVRLPLLRRLMVLGIQLIVPRHRIGVVMVTFDELGRVFMLKHVFHPGAPWGLPGGWLNRHESPAVGVLRELKEETGLTADLDSIVLIENQTQPAHIGIAYLGHIRPGSITLSAEIIAADWFPTDNLPGPLPQFAQSAIDTAVKKYQKKQECL